MTLARATPRPRTAAARMLGRWLLNSPTARLLAESGVAPQRLSRDHAERHAGSDEKGEQALGRAEPTQEHVDQQGAERKAGPERNGAHRRPATWRRRPERQGLTDPEEKPRDDAHDREASGPAERVQREQANLPARQQAAHLFDKDHTAGEAGTKPEARPQHPTERGDVEEAAQLKNLSRSKKSSDQAGENRRDQNHADHPLDRLAENDRRGDTRGETDRGQKSPPKRLHTILPFRRRVPASEHRYGLCGADEGFQLLGQLVGAPAYLAAPGEVGQENPESRFLSVGPRLEKHEGKHEHDFLGVRQV